MNKKICEKFISISTDCYVVSFLILLTTQLVSVIGGIITLQDEKINNFLYGYLGGVAITIGALLIIIAIFTLLIYLEKFIKYLKRNCAEKHDVYYNEYRDF